jgi:predicted N-acetyltransferase YhbS
MHIREATPQDNAALQALQARCPMGTTLLVSTVNRPDFFSRARAYEWSRVYVACERQEILGSAACATRQAAMDGGIGKVGYEFQYFIAPGHRRRGIAQALHERITEQLRAEGARLTYLVVIEGNAPAMRLFEGLGFERVRTLVMPGLVVYREMDEGLGQGEIRTATREDLAEIAALRDETWGRHRLYDPLSADELAAQIERMPAYGLGDILVAEAEGQICGCVGYWDWSQITRITVQGQSWKMRLIGLGLTVGGWFRALPDPIRAGDTLKQVVLTPLAWRDTAALERLLRRVNNLCLQRGIGQIFCVGEAGSALLGHLQGFIHIDTDLHLYVKPLREGARIGAEIGDGPVYLDGRDL